jgi:4-amino-4-deoxyprephenate dehydrogenase
MRTADLGTVVVLGAAGGVGRLFTAILPGDVTGVDLAGAALRGDATDPDEALLARVRAAGCVVLCLPEAPALRAIERLLPELATGALFVDTLSVKAPVVERIDRHDIEALSLNPLFAPDVGLRGQSVAAVPVRPGPRSQVLISCLERAGASVVTTTALEHDRSAALTQAATHAALLAYGLCLARADPPLDPAFATPPQRAMLALVARIVTRDAEVYRHVQADNPYAPQARDALAAAVAEVGGAAADPADFAALLRAVADALEPELADLAQRSARLLRP